jgi:hypothetical protein
MKKGIGILALGLFLMTMAGCENREHDRDVKSENTPEQESGQQDHTQGVDEEDEDSGESATNEGNSQENQ